MISFIGRFSKKLVIIDRDNSNYGLAGPACSGVALRQRTPSLPQIRNRRASIWAPITSLAARGADKSAALNPNLLPTSSTAADSPAFDAPLALGTYSFAGII